MLRDPADDPRKIEATLDVQLLLIDPPSDVVVKPHRSGPARFISGEGGSIGDHPPQRLEIATLCNRVNGNCLRETYRRILAWMSFRTATTRSHVSTETA